MIALKYLPLVIPAAIAGMAIVSSLTPPQSKANLQPYATSLLSLARLRTIDYFKTGSQRTPEGLWVTLHPQSTYALHGWFGSPAYTSETQDVYEIAGTCNGIEACQKVVFYYTADPYSGYQPKASSAFIPNSLLRRNTRRR